MKYIKTFEDMVTKDVSTDDILKMLRKGFKNYTQPNTEFPLEIKDKDGKLVKTVKMKVDGDGELKVASMNEANKFVKSLAGLCLIGGILTSCSKPTTGFQYNIDVKPTTYYLDKGTPNKKIDILTPSGQRSISVDSSQKKVGSFSGQTVYFDRPITNTESYILKNGAVYQGESNYNNGNGYDPNKIATKCYINDTWVHDEQHTDDGGSTTSVREHPLWDKGIEYLKIKGEDTDSLIQKADIEVHNKQWIN